MMASMEIYQRIVRETKRRRKGRREWKIEIPNDVMEEIVMKLPVRSIMRFQAVSKHWESVIKTRDFGARHMAHQRNKDPKLMFVSYGFDHIRFEQRDLETTSLEERLCFEIEEINGPIEISECCDGLVCFYCLTQAVRVINTATETPLDHHQILSNQRPPCANGLLYWLTGDEQGYPSTQTKLIVFDIHTEMFQVTSTPPFITPDASSDKIGLCNLNGRLCISELKGDCKQEFWWRVEECNKWERIFSVDLNSTSCWFGGITSQPLTPLAISRDNNKVVLSLTYQGSLVDFDLDPDSTVYHLYYSGYYGLAIPYFPSLSLSFSSF
ncbi:BnaCnng25050D [Brassica napus]|uniref:BnaCnng25050D protein n=1 Tax=Brassica napus TaxID=3708 RepID=A0A078ITS3_BRANA|nr:BnaCnng25050D [Brassica napus]